MQVIFAVSDVARAAALYEEAFGWRRNTAIDYRNYVELLVDGGALGLYERAAYGEEVGAKAAPIPDEAVAPSYLYVRVEDVDGVAARLAAAGARPLSPLSERAWGERAAWFADPDGNVVAVADPAPGIAE